MKQVEFVKGEAILSELGWVKHKKGVNGLDKVFKELNEGVPDSQKLDYADLNGNEWYPAKLQHDILATIRDEFGDGDPEVLEEVGAYGIEKITQFAFVLRFLKVKTVAKKMKDNLMVLYRPLDVFVSESGKKGVVVILEGFPGSELYLHLLKGGVAHMLTILKMKNGRVKAEILQEGVPGRLRFSLSWD